MDAHRRRAAASRQKIPATESRSVTRVLRARALGVEDDAGARAGGAARDGADFPALGKGKPAVIGRLPWFDSDWSPRGCHCALMLGFGECMGNGAAPNKCFARAKMVQGLRGVAHRTWLDDGGARLGAKHALDELDQACAKKWLHQARGAERF